VVRCCKHGNCYDIVHWCAVVVNIEPSGEIL